ncbi:MAG: transcription-repair coupling factor, partial [Verrucomicrobia bacterium]|nr:transcription-repair coupling factor [Verrucomicrobiota bacterium]
GFKIAMRDLEIRGAGNLLGPQQSGHITAVGFDLYCQLLKQSVASLKGEKIKPRVMVQVCLDFLALNPGEETTASTAAMMRYPAYVPMSYISEPQQRIEFYRKLAQASEKPDVELLRQEMRDRFGPLPPSVELLLQVSDLKLLSSERNITVLETKGDKLMLTRNGEPMLIGGKFPRLMKQKPKDRLNEIRKLLLAI